MSQVAQDEFEAVKVVYENANGDDANLIESLRFPIFEGMEMDNVMVDDGIPRLVKLDADASIWESMVSVYKLGGFIHSLSYIHMEDY